MTPLLDAVTVVGARPNLVKAAALHRQFSRRPGIRHRLLNTGQHYDEALFGGHFPDLDLPRPAWNLGVGSGPHGMQTGRMMEGIEAALLAGPPPDVLIVPGDVNSSLAAALVAAKAGIPVAHVEAGLRSFDRTMPEEVNRRVIDAVAAVHFATEEAGVRNLLAEGVDPGGIHLCGNVHADVLEATRPAWASLDGPAGGGPYGVLTLHRQASADDPAVLAGLLPVLSGFARRFSLRILFPVHPRTLRSLQQGGADGVESCDSLPYLRFIRVLSGASVVFTDSGGVQAEACLLGVPCVTLRESTEHECTVGSGGNRLAGLNPDSILRAGEDALLRGPGSGPPHALWDGRAGERIVDALVGRFAEGREPVRADRGAHA